MVTEPLQAPEPEDELQDRFVAMRDSADLWYGAGVNLHTRTLYIGSDPSANAEVDITDNLAERVIKGLHLLHNADPTGGIHIILNCVGGYVSHGFAIYDYIKTLTNPIMVSVFGSCASMAVVLLQAGDWRRISANSSLMIHWGSTTIGGYNQQTLRAWYSFTQQESTRYSNIILASIRKKKPKFSKKRLEEWMMGDTLFSAEGTVREGFADEVILPVTKTI